MAVLASIKIFSEITTLPVVFLLYLISLIPEYWTQETHHLIQNPETAQVWREAGFIPPAFYLKLIEFMHRRSMGEPEMAPRTPEQRKRPAL